MGGGGKCGVLIPVLWPLENTLPDKYIFQELHLWQLQNGMVILVAFAWVCSLVILEKVLYGGRKQLYHGMEFHQHDSILLPLFPFSFS